MALLSKSEVAELTGAKTKRRQIENLRQNGIFFTVDALGWPKVPANYAELDGGKARAKKSSSGPAQGWKGPSFYAGAGA